MKIFLLFGIVLCPLFLNAQEKEEYKQDSVFNKFDYFLINNDTATIHLDPVFLVKPIRFANANQSRYYFWYRKIVLKTYPYATLAADRLTALNRQLTQIKSESKRRKHIIKMQNYMEGEFTDQLKKMTRTEGKILIKLINRQTGFTVFDLIKEYRSGWKAFWYQLTATLFKISLKSEYHPESVGKDYIVEDILQHAFKDGSLIPQPSFKPIDFQELNYKYQKIDYVKEITAKD